MRKKYIKRIVIYGAGKNCSILLEYACFKNVEIIAIVDKYKVGACLGNYIIEGTDVLLKYSFDEILVTPFNNYEIISFLLYDCGIDAYKIVLPEEINSRYILVKILNKKNTVISIKAKKNSFFYFVFSKLVKENKMQYIRLLRCNGKIRIDICTYEDKQLFFMTFDAITMLDMGLFDALENSFPNAKKMLWFCDPCDDDQYDIPRLINRFGGWVNLKNYFDYCYTYHFGDAVKYNLINYPLFYPSIDKKKYQSKKSYDVFFIGNAKNRYELIKSIYSKLSKVGVRCLFYVRGVETKNRIHGIRYINEYMDYNEALFKMLKCRCILDVCDPGNETSQRYAEAVYFGKKLLVNDIGVVKKEYYNPKNIFIYSSANDINPNWILDDNDDYHYKGNLDTEYILRKIVGNM